METVDHLTLSKWLTRTAGKPLTKRMQRGFLIGSVAPDYNPFTYVKGVVGKQGLHGHNAEITDRLVEKRLSRARQRGVKGFWDGYRLGVAFHYLADAFTYPHHGYFDGSIAEHIRYESRLHLLLSAFLSRFSPENTVSLRLPECTEEAQELYSRLPPSPENDCRFITRICYAVLEQISYGNTSRKEYPSSN